MCGPEGLLRQVCVGVWWASLLAFVRLLFTSSWCCDTFFFSLLIHLATPRVQFHHSMVHNTNLPACTPDPPTLLPPQVRERAAAAGVPVAGENALPCFMPNIIDETALHRIVYNTQVGGRVGGPVWFEVAAAWQGGSMAKRLAQQSGGWLFGCGVSTNNVHCWDGRDW